MLYLLRQTKCGSKELIVTLRKIDDQIIVLYSQFNSHQLLNKSSKRKKSATRDAAPDIFFDTPRARTVKNNSSPEFSVDEPKFIRFVLHGISPSYTTECFIHYPPLASTQQVNPSDSWYGLMPRSYRPTKETNILRQIFVTRLAPDTSEINISAHIRAESKVVIK